MTSLAATVSVIPVTVPPRQIRALATALADAVRDLDTRTRAGLTPPVLWQPPHRDPIPAADLFRQRARGR